MNDKDAKNEYHYSDEQVDAMDRAVQTELQGLVNAARATRGAGRLQLDGPRTPKPSTRKKRRLAVRASRKTNR